MLPELKSLLFILQVMDLLRKHQVVPVRLDVTRVFRVYHFTFLEVQQLPVMVVKKH